MIVRCSVFCFITPNFSPQTDFWRLKLRFDMKNILLTFACLLLLSGCEAAIGDKCDTSNECPTGTVCDTDSPGGYCLTYNCETDEECPENSVCVAFTKAISYCLLKCDKPSDCRGGYACRDDVGTQKFCYVPADYQYGRDESNKIPFEPPQE
jgi:hypothetical protein